MSGDGSLLTVDQFKNYGFVEHDGDDELIGDLIEEAEARMVGYLEVPIAADTFTEYHDGGTSVLTLHRYPIDEDSVTVTDTQGTSEDVTDDEVMAATTYRIYADRGQIMRTSSAGQRKTWAHGRRRWKVEYDGGLDKHPLWESVVKLDLRGSIRDLVKEWYDNRSPGAALESEGGGISRTIEAEDRGIPIRVREVWDRYRAPQFGG